MKREDREWAIKYGTEWLKDEYLYARDGAFIELALEALKREPCENAISREDALMCLTGEIKDTDTIETIIARSARRIRKLPPVTPTVVDAGKQEPNTWSLDDAREDFMSDVYNTLDFLPTNNEANKIIDSFDRVTSSIKQEPCEGCEYKLRGEVEQKTGYWEKTTDGYCYWYKCSCCGAKAPKNEWGNDYFSPYCPECNAKMLEIPTD